LHEALQRAATVSSSNRICTVVAEQHRQWWQPMLYELPSANVIVQPMNRGTGNGVLLALLHIAEREPKAWMVVMPSDHHVREEAVLSSSMRQAVAGLVEHPREIVLLGLTPERTDPELGYIMPRCGTSEVLEVEQFVEKPPMSVAHKLIEHGGLWNAFILAGTAQALLALFLRRVPQVVADLRAAVRSDRATADNSGGRVPGGAIRNLYQSLPDIDFSRDILTGDELHLRVLPVPQCGWSDLGTPSRIGEALRRTRSPYTSVAVAARAGYISLAARFEALGAQNR
jgi:mannose-1-phosphate guanylyltransferase